MNRDIDKTIEDVAKNGSTAPSELEIAFRTARGRIEKAKQAEANVVTQLARAVITLSESHARMSARIDQLERQVRLK